MQLRGLVCLCFVIMCVTSFAAAEEVAPLTLIHGTLIDGTGNAPIPDAALIIQGDRILAADAADAVEIPTNAKIIDVQGATILPGFINAHVHYAYDEQKLAAWAQDGVTTVRDLGAGMMGEQWFTRRDELNRSTQQARLVSVGTFITVPGGYPIVPWGAAGITITSPEDATQKTEELLQKGADLIKLSLERGQVFNQAIPVPSPEEAAAVTTAAHKYGTLVSTHITAVQDIEPALNAGVDDLAHMVVTGDIPDDLLAKIIKAGTYWTPTLELWYGVQQNHSGRRAHEIAIKNLRRFVEAGGKVALGTDYAGYSSSFDLGMPIRELGWMRDAGMTPMQIIVAATKHAAHVCNMEKELGTLEPGKIADVIVVSGNPLEDILAMQNVSMVIHNGQMLERALTAGAAYRDGTYEAQDKPDVEGYYAKAKIVVADGKITTVEWNIFDKYRNDRIFDETYEEVFAGNTLYQEQCRKDLAGAKIYGSKLVETQNLDNVDAISGATWAHKKFVNIMKPALEQAKP